ncbi:MAG: YHS domain-containing protein [Mariprofundaceae bacterium]|nr:YHS domain-containing protein [Mariprofundaceae bacterium]
MTIKQCPVCGMDASTSEITTEHLGISYHFCSLQCMENFADHPHLYLAVKSPKRKGKSVIKKRSFTLDTPITEPGLDTLKTDMCNMMGIRDLQVTGTKVSVTYDLLEVTAIQVEQRLEQAGARLGAGWADRLKRGWIHYTEENELDHLAATDTTCCNKPPGRG